MRMIAIHAQTERKRLDRSVRCAEKRRPWARKQRLRGLIRPDPAVCATAGAACGRKSLSSARIQAIFTSNDTPLGECRMKAIPPCVRIWRSGFVKKLSICLNRCRERKPLKMTMRIPDSSHCRIWGHRCASMRTSIVRAVWWPATESWKSDANLWGCRPITSFRIGR